MNSVTTAIRVLLSSLSLPAFLLDNNFCIIWKNNAADSVSYTNLDNKIIDSIKSTKENLARQINPATNNESAHYILLPSEGLLLPIISLSSSCAVYKAKTSSSPYLRKQTEDENNIDHLTFSSKAMGKVFNLARKAATVDTNVFITGETGVGKSSIAKLIHSMSLRQQGPLLAINCGAIPPTLLESELFGYEKGAFTGADRAGCVGLLEAGNGGTIFLDEVSELPANLQVKLLHAIEEKTIMRVGGRKPVKLDIRVIAATNKDPQKLLAEGGLREDLFYRLNVISIHIPPLRNRREDISPLVQYFLKRFNQKYNVQKTVSPRVIDAFTHYNWPGNIRELQNTLERMVVMSEKDELTINDLPSHILTSFIASSSPAASANRACNFGTRIEVLERELILKALQGNKSIRAAARELGVSHATLLRKIRKLKIDADGMVFSLRKDR